MELIQVNQIQMKLKIIGKKLFIMLIIFTLMMKIKKFLVI